VRRKRTIAALALILLILLSIAAALIYRYTQASYADLFEAAKAGSVRGTRALLARGVHVNTRDSDQGTALFYAAGYAHPEVVQLLLEAGADASILDKHGATALRYSLFSASSDSLRCDELLIAAGCLKYQKSPLCCTWSSLTAAAHVRLLLQHGADASADNSAAVRIFAENDDVETVALLLQHGGRINAVAEDGRTALTMAVTQGNIEAVEFLVRHGADTTVRLQGRSLLELAIAVRQEFRNARHDAVIRFLKANTVVQP